MTNEAHGSRLNTQPQTKNAVERPRAEREAEEALIRGKEAADEAVENGRRIAEEATNIARLNTETIQQTVRSGIVMATQIAELSVEQIAGAVGLPTKGTEESCLPIPTKPPPVSEMIAPPDSEMMSPPGPPRRGRAGYGCCCFVRVGRRGACSRHPDRGDGRCGRAGRGWRQHRSDGRSPHAMPRSAAGW
jgi:hypothetical protein